MLDRWAAELRREVHEQNVPSVYGISSPDDEERMTLTRGQVRRLAWQMKQQADELRRFAK